MPIPKNASFTRSPHFADLAEWAGENLPTESGFYIIHFDSPLGANSESPRGPADHYCGHAADLHDRFIAHLKGCGAGGSRLTEVCNEQGIRFYMHYWPMPYDDALATELYHKASVKNPRRFCPCCGGKRLPKPRASTLAKLLA